MLSAASHYQRPLSSGAQSFPPAPASEAPVGQPVHKVEGFKQTCGEAKFSSDLTPSLASSSLFAAPVLATEVGKVLTKIDASKALATAGVVDFVCAADLQLLGARNQVLNTPYLVFAEANTPTQCVGQIVGMTPIFFQRFILLGFETWVCLVFEIKACLWPRLPRLQFAVPRRMFK